MELTQLMERMEIRVLMGRRKPMEPIELMELRDGAGRSPPALP